MTSDTTIVLSSDSATGRLDTSAGGAFSSKTTSVTITAGNSATTFFFKDIVSGSPTITAAESPSSLGWTDATQVQTVNPGPLTSTDVEPEDLVENRTGDVAISFTTTHPLPADGKIAVTFPAGFTVSSGTVTGIGGDGTNFGGVESVFILGQVATITRDGLGSELPASTGVTLELTNIGNPTAGLTDTYSIKTTNSSGFAIDEDTSVTGDVIAVDVSETSSATVASTAQSATTLDRTSTTTLGDSWVRDLRRTASTTLASTAQSSATFGRTTAATITDTVGLEIPRTSTAILGDSYTVVVTRDSTATLGDASQKAATFGRTSTTTINDTLGLGIPRTSTTTLDDSFDLGFPATLRPLLSTRFNARSHSPGHRLPPWPTPLRATPALAEPPRRRWAIPLAWNSPEPRHPPSATPPEHGRLLPDLDVHPGRHCAERCPSRPSLGGDAWRFL